jgi:hypothetical protein
MNYKLVQVIRAAKILKKNIDGIIKAILFKATNALRESMDGKYKNQITALRLSLQRYDHISFERTRVISKKNFKPQVFLDSPIFS